MHATAMYLHEIRHYIRNHPGPWISAEEVQRALEEMSPAEIAKVKENLKPHDFVAEHRRAAEAAAQARGGESRCCCG